MGLDELGLWSLCVRWDRLWWRGTSRDKVDRLVVLVKSVVVVVVVVVVVLRVEDWVWRVGGRCKRDRMLLLFVALVAPTIGALGTVNKHHYISSDAFPRAKPAWHYTLD